MKKNALSFSILVFVLLTINVKGQSLKDRIIKDYSVENWGEFESRIQFDIKNIKEKGIKPFGKDSTKLLTGYSYGEFYDWDLYFENIYMSYFGVSEYCFSNLKAFLKRQDVSGFTSRTLKAPRQKQQFKPFLAQIAVLGSKQINNYQWLLEKVDGDKNTFTFQISYYERLKKSVDYWFWYDDNDKNGLPVWNSSDHSGMDNQISRVGNVNEFKAEGVDLACYLYRELKSLAFIAEKLNEKEDVIIFNKKADELAINIMQTFWDEKDGFFYDRNERTSKSIKVKSVAGFMPLYIGIVPKDKAERIIKEHLLNEDEFWLKYPVACYAKTEPDYSQTVHDWGCNWRGTTWIPTNYMIIHALNDYGYKKEAKELAQKTFDLVFKENKVTREYFNAETGKGLGLNPFWGWSTLAYFIPFELEMGYNPMELNDKPIQNIGTKVFGINFNE